MPTGQSQSAHADEWTQVIHRMIGYAAVSQPIKPQRLADPARAGTPEQYRKPAEFLATINLSATPAWEYSLKTLPRPKGEGTRVIVTEYDLPRPRAPWRVWWSPPRRRAPKSRSA